METHRVQHNVIQMIVNDEIRMRQRMGPMDIPAMENI